MMKRIFITITLLLAFSFVALAQGVVGVKTNLLYGAVTYTPNLGVEIGLGKKTTLDIAAGYNPWRLNNNELNTKKLVHLIVQPEFRYYFCERFNGHFIGVHGLYSEYNIRNHNLPMLFGSGSKHHRFKGDAYGGGISYGYQLLLGYHWNLEFEVGVGYAHLNYDKYDCAMCGVKVGSFTKNYFGPTKAGISLVFLIR